MLIPSNKVSEIRNYHNSSLAINISYVCCAGMHTNHLHKKLYQLTSLIGI